MLGKLSTAYIVEMYTSAVSGVQQLYLLSCLRLLLAEFHQNY